MSVLNAVRAKLVHRMFAVIRNNQDYQSKRLCQCTCVNHKNRGSQKQQKASHVPEYCKLIYNYQKNFA
ncbi:hypothetical protein Barb6_02421 [Bacteroidales bacterium Barb6]|nr:hypothetical protein Barb6_02421 [Bacteroidales bacterium Barb6]